MPSSLVRGKYVITKVTAESGAQVVEDGAVFQRDGEIVEVGRYDDLRSRYAADEEIGSSDFVVMPGLVNAHHHAGLTSFQMGALDSSLETWSIDRWASRDVDPYLDTLYCALQMIESGITTVMHNQALFRLPSDTGLYDSSARILQAYADSGMRVAFSLAQRDMNRLVLEDDERFLATLPADLSQGVAKLLNSRPVSTEEYLALCGELYDRHHSDRTRIFVSPLNVVWSSDELLRGIRDFATERSTGIHVHLQETWYQRSYGERRWGKTPLAYLHDLDFLGPHVSCAHGVWLTEADMELLDATGTAICHNPSSNLRLKSGIAPVNRLLENGATVALGIDSDGLNDDYDIFQEMRLAHRIHRVPGVASKSPTSDQVLQMATANGANVCLFGDTVGTLEPGNRADLALVRLDRIVGPYLHPDTRVVDALVYRAKGMDVDTVIVDGEVLLKGGKHVRLDREEIAGELGRSLAAPLKPAEVRRGELGRRLLPHVQRYFEEWPLELDSPYYAYNDTAL